MALPGYHYPLSGAVARGANIAAFGAGIVIGDWTTPTLWPYAGGNFSAGIVLASGTPGISDVTSDGATGVWAVGYTGTLWHQPASGAATNRALPSGAVYTSCAFTAVSAYVMTSSGAVLTSGGTTLGTFPSYGFGLSGSGSVLAALLPASGVGTMTTAGVTGLIAFPAGLATPSCLAMTSGTPLAIAGWQPAASLAAANAAALNPVDATAMVAVSAGNAVQWRAAAGLTDAWAQTQALTGLASLNAMAWSPDGFHVMASSVTSGVVQILAYATGVLSLTQTLAVSGACAVAFGADSLHALVAQSGQSQLATLNFTSLWATGVPVTGLAGITTIAAYGSSGAVAACTAGLAWLSLASGIWLITGTTAVGFTPTVLAVDAFQQVYAAASGQLAVVGAAGSVIGSGSFAGVPGAIVVQQGRVVLSLPAANTLSIYGQAAPASWSLQASTTLSLGASIGLALSDTTLFAMGSGSTVTFGFSGTPFVLTNVVSGAVAQRSAGSWTVTPLGIGHTPSAIGYDAAGNLRVATTQNTTWVISSGGTALSSGVVPQIPAQNQSVPLGVAALLASPSGMFCATTIPGVLIEIP